ncbi:MAG TPA: hypothetical protein VJS90_13870 [Pseudomonas sp.]|uniref:hypothetical protein n=1 Tax=Pseudomonas sp. TaxID=306 RepID=UPI002B476319|nr:hypothetical protein [Pseudomonas sp.]HKS14109.1 hypothetical protein [Pseudomonas sp.]
MRSLNVLAVAFLAGSGNQGRYAKGWNRGGTLHDVSLREWAFSTDANRLATSADFVHEYIPEVPDDGLWLMSGLIEKCLADSSCNFAVESLNVRGRLNLYWG